MKFTLNKKSIEVTDSWETMTFGQYLKVLKMKGTMTEIISIITGIEEETLKKAKIKGLDKLLYAAKFLNEPPQFNVEKLTHIGEYKLPLNSKGIFDVTFESLEQIEDLRNVMAKLPEGIYAHTEAYATYCAIYVQKLRDGDYDGDKAMAMVPEIMTYPASDVINAGSFFFVKLSSLLNGTPNNSQNTTPTRTKSTGKRSKRNSARTPRLTKSRER